MGKNKIIKIPSTGSSTSGVPLLFPLKKSWISALQQWVQTFMYQEIKNK